tara:strand:+ start:2069 stop:2974 length:906 start_codon:yes stop_codon:yes gene_type:complete
MNPYKKNLEHMKLFIDFIENQKRYSPHTIRAYKVDLNQLVDHLGEELAIIELNKYDLHEYISIISKSISSKSLSRKIATIKSLFKYLVDQNIVKVNISKSLKIPKINKKLPNHLTIDEMNTFFDKTLKIVDISSRDLLIIDLLYSTGIRASECIEISINNIDLNKNTIRITGKGGKTRLVIFGDKTKQNISSYLNSKAMEKNNGYLFPSRLKKKKLKNNFITTRTIYNIVKKYIKFVSNNEKLGPHSLRHSFATHLLQSGSDLMAIKDLLGHESLGSTQIYTHLDTKRMKDIYNKSHPHAK